MCNASASDFANNLEIDPNWPILCKDGPSENRGVKFEGNCLAKKGSQLQRCANLMTDEAPTDIRSLAIDAARNATAALDALGVTVLVIGSLTRGQFGVHSDIDFLVTRCPRNLKYAIEGVVEDALGGLRFDVVYLDELPAWKAANFIEGAIPAADLR
jgi:predicted nucleotidyltransferase